MLASGRSLIASRRRRLIALVAAALGITVLGLLAARLVKSPAQVAADTAAPPRTTLTSTVELRVLKQTVVLRGSVTPRRSVEVTPSGAVGADRLVVTGAHVRQGDTVQPGQVLLVVSGRPIVALHGGTPAYRDLRPGAKGADVKQLQNALQEKGFRSRDRAGFFGRSTKKALTDFYASIGFAVATTGVDDDLAVAAATRQVRDAQRSLDAAIAAHAPAADVQRLRDALADATAQRDSLVAHTGPMLPASEAVFLPTFPARVTKFAAAVGDDVKPPLITLASGDLVVRADLSPADRSQVRPGQPVELLADGIAATVAGTLASIGELTDSANGAGRSHPLTITAKLPPDWVGQQVRVTIIVASTAAPVLVVPLSAVYAGADARTSVTVVRGTSQARVVVNVGATGDGFVEVQPVGGAPAAGDQVVVGVR